MLCRTTMRRLVSSFATQRLFSLSSFFSLPPPSLLDPEMELRAAARTYRDQVQRWAEEQNGDPA